MVNNDENESQILKKNTLIKNLSRERKEKKRTGERDMGKGDKINRERRRGRNRQAEPMRERLKDKERVNERKMRCAMGIENTLSLLLYMFSIAPRSWKLKFCRTLLLYRHNTIQISRVDNILHLKNFLINPF